MRLHDEYFLPERLWTDLEAVSSELEKGGLFDKPPDLSTESGTGASPPTRLEKGWHPPHRPQGAGELAAALRDPRGRWAPRADSWIPPCSGWNFAAIAAFHARYRIYVNGRPLALRKMSADTFLSGLRYRRTNLYPSMHPGIPTQLPLLLTFVDGEIRTSSPHSLRSARMTSHFALWRRGDRAARRAAPVGVAGRAI